MRRETAGLLDRRFEKVFRSFFGERNGELSMVKKNHFIVSARWPGAACYKTYRIYARSLS